MKEILSSKVEEYKSQIEKVVIQKCKITIFFALGGQKMLKHAQHTEYLYLTR